MKKWDIFVIAVVAGLMLIPLFFTMIMSGWYVNWVATEQLSDVQREAVYTALRFEPLAEENMSADYHPGFMQATTSVTVRVQGISSEEAFLERLGCPYEFAEGEAYRFDGTVSSYKIAPFDIPEGTYVKDYYAFLYVKEDADGLTATFDVSGYLPEMTTVYELLDDPWQPYLRNSSFIVCVVIEVVLCGYLLVRGIIRLVGRIRRKRILSKEMCMKEAGKRKG